MRHSIKFKGKTIALDHGKGDVVFLSHAHADHINGMKRIEELVASEETKDLAGIKAKIKKIKGLRLEEAGHILGAKQLVIEEDGKRIVYTGDFSFNETGINKPAKIIECDELIIDGTFNKPEYVFPDYERIKEEIGKWIKKNEKNIILIGAYNLGKTQELIKIINEYTGEAPVVMERAEEFNKIYEKYGIKLDRIVVGSEEAEEVMKGPFIAIIPMHLAKRSFAKKISKAFEKKVRLSVATGWAIKYSFNVDKAFPLSDHGDYRDIQRYIQESGAKKVEFL